MPGKIRQTHCYGRPSNIAIAAAKNGNGNDADARSQTMRAGMSGTSQISSLWIAYRAQAVEYAMTCGAPAPLLSAAAPIENPTTAPPGVNFFFLMMRRPPRNPD